MMSEITECSVCHKEFIFDYGDPSAFPCVSHCEGGNTVQSGGRLINFWEVLPGGKLVEATPHSQSAKQGNNQLPNPLD